VNDGSTNHETLDKLFPDGINAVVLLVAVGDGESASALEPLEETGSSTIGKLIS